MKKVVLLFLSLFFLIDFVNAQSVSIHETGQISNLMYAYRSYNRKRDITDGYRIQISFTNSREEAYSAKTKLLRAFPNEHCYVEYEQPYYKLRMGDYEDRLQAYGVWMQVIPIYQGAFLVKDKIKFK